MEERLDGFLNCLYEKQKADYVQYDRAEAEELKRLQSQKREELKRALGIPALESLACGVEESCKSIEKRQEYDIESSYLTILSGFKMPLHIVRSRYGNGKYILYAHGHGEGGCKDSLIENNKAYHKSIPIILAKRGYTVFMFEPAAFGNFIVRDYSYSNEGACYPLATQLLMHGMTALGLRVFQARATAEYMRSKEGIAEYSILGISGGGAVCAMYGALYDDIKANIISCYSNLFKTSIMAVRHCVDNFIPGILRIGEMPHIISLCAPRPLFLSSGISDDIFPAEGSKEAYEYIKGVYRRLGVQDRVKQELFEGVHEFSTAFIDWLDALAD